MNSGQTMEYKRICYRRSFNVYRVMLKGESVKTGEGCQESFNIGLTTANNHWEERTKDCPRCRLDGIPMNKKPSVFVVQPQGRYQPAKITLARDNKDRYLKLYNGDIYCTRTNTILDRDLLLSIIS